MAVVSTDSTRDLETVSVPSLLPAETIVSLYAREMKLTYQR
jgi:hypothetical protein